MWLTTQSPANPSRGGIPCNREINREFYINWAVQGGGQRLPVNGLKHQRDYLTNLARHPQRPEPRPSRGRAGRWRPPLSSLLEQRLEGRLWSASSVDRGVGIERNRRNNPRQSHLPMHLSPRCRARTRAGTPCRSPAMTNGRCRMHGGTSPGAPKSNGHALKHGRYTAEAIAEQREFTALVRDMKGLLEQVEGDE
jgi:hypothetical protein